MRCSEKAMRSGIIFVIEYVRQVTKRVGHEGKRSMYKEMLVLFGLVGTLLANDTT